jgi:hypothetical protein
MAAAYYADDVLESNTGLSRNGIFLATTLKRELASQNSRRFVIMPNNTKQNDQKRDSQGQFTDKSLSSSPGHSSQGDKGSQSGKSSQSDSQDKDRMSDMGHKSGQSY